MSEYRSPNTLLGVDLGVLRGERIDECGNRVVSAFVCISNSIDIWHWECGPGFGEDQRWRALHTRQDFAHFGVWVNPALRASFSYVEGDTCLTVCEDEEAWFAECKYLAGFHKCDMPPGCAKKIFHVG